MRRASYLQRISGQRLTLAPVLKPATPLFRRWEMTQFALRSEERPRRLETSTIAGELEPRRPGDSESDASQTAAGSQESFGSSLAAGGLHRSAEHVVNAAPNAAAPAGRTTLMHRAQPEKESGSPTSRARTNSFPIQTLDHRLARPSSRTAANQDRREIANSGSVSNADTAMPGADAGERGSPAEYLREQRSVSAHPTWRSEPARSDSHSPALYAHQRVITAPVPSTEPGVPPKPGTSAAASVRIGSIEVRVLPSSAPAPPRAVKHSTSPGLLSRGFLSCFGLRQG